MIHRKYNHKKDKQAAIEVWKEVGWARDGMTKTAEMICQNAKSIVADIDGRVESIVNSWAGDIVYQKEKIKFSYIQSVLTSLVARRQKLAGKLTAEMIALDAADGIAITGLGMFEQGYYNMLGFGNGTYEHMVNFAPSSINVDITPGVPIRLTKNDWKMVHRARLNRMRLHGSCIADAPEATGAEMAWSDETFGLGYKNKKGKLTHFLWMNGKTRENGPFDVWGYAYQTYDQFLELMALMRSFGEQVHMMFILEPPNIQFQDFLDKPFKHRMITKKSEYENGMRASAWWQTRIIDLKKCIATTKLNCDDIKFNLKLYDPIERFLDKDAPWHGLTGNYIVTFGRKSLVKKGTDKALPTLDADIGAFTRLWLGCATASSLAVADAFAGPKSLIEKLEDGFSILPTPHPDWPF